MEIFSKRTAFVVFFWLAHVNGSQSKEILNPTLLSRNQPEPLSNPHRSARAAQTSSARKWKFDDYIDSEFRTTQRRFNKSEVTWRIDQFSTVLDLSNSDVLHAISSAFQEWSRVIPIDFRHITNKRENVDIVVRFCGKSAGNVCEHRFREETLAVCVYRLTPLAIHFNGEVEWVIGPAPPPFFDLYTVALHEIGHALGLEGHPHQEGALMTANYGVRFKSLTAFDISAIQAIYGARTTPQNTPMICTTASDGIVRGMRLMAHYKASFVNNENECKAQCEHDTGCPAMTYDASRTFSNGNCFLMVSYFISKPDPNYKWSAWFKPPS